jgi:hypothetical protein
MINVFDRVEHQLYIDVINSPVLTNTGTTNTAQVVQLVYVGSELRLEFDTLNSQWYNGMTATIGIVNMPDSEFDIENRAITQQDWDNGYIVMQSVITSNSYAYSYIYNLVEKKCSNIKIDNVQAHIVVSAAFLNEFKVKRALSYPPFIPIFNRLYTGLYTLNLPVTSAVSIFITPEVGQTAIVKCNGNIIDKLATSYPLNMPTSGIYSIEVEVTASPTDKKTYKLDITRA